ncbi:hypothetical protein [Streptomyces sp. Tue6028]|uniref:hypothetical protein n=1 Tax=Streptomyces sp. Tue6028 TaxID=2036037 RepID=UPI003EBB4E63
MKITTMLVGISTAAAIAGCSAADTDRTAAPSTTRPGISPSGFPSPRGPYRDGKYSVDGQYGTRGSSIGVSLTVRDDKITAVDVSPHATDETSLGLQRRFAEAVPALVIGRDIDDVALDRVAGNSHTPIGFNDALEKIKAEASR